MNFLSPLAPHAHWFLRLSVASVFLYHGLTKFPNLEGVSGMLGFPVALVVVLALVETVAGVLILLGGVSKDWMTRLAGLIFVVIMIGAIFKVHLSHGWNSIGNLGMEFQVTLLTIGLYFAARGNNGANGATPAPAE